MVAGFGFRFQFQRLEDLAKLTPSVGGLWLGADVLLGVGEDLRLECVEGGKIGSRNAGWFGDGLF